MKSHLVIWLDSECQSCCQHDGSLSLLDEEDFRSTISSALHADHSRAGAMGTHSMLCLARERPLCLHNQASVRARGLLHALCITVDSCEHLPAWVSPLPLLAEGVVAESAIPGKEYDDIM